MLDLVDLAVFAVAERGGGVLALAVDPQVAVFSLEARAVVGTGGVGGWCSTSSILIFFGSSRLALELGRICAIALVATVLPIRIASRARSGHTSNSGIVPAGLAEQG